MSIKFKCPFCEEEIENLEYTSNVTEYGRMEIDCNDNNEVEESDRNCDDSETDETNTKCPECHHTLETEDIIITRENEKPKTASKFKIGDKVKIIRDTCNHQIKIGKKLKIGRIEKLMMWPEKTEPFNPYFTAKDIEFADKSKLIDNGESETDDMIIEKENKEEFEVDPMLKNGAICPQCKYFFADSDSTITNYGDTIMLKEGLYVPIESHISTCPKCTHEFEKTKEFNKLITKK